MEHTYYYYYSNYDIDKYYIISLALSIFSIMVLTNKKEAKPKILPK